MHTRDWRAGGAVNPPPALSCRPWGDNRQRSECLAMMKERKPSGRRLHGETAVNYAVSLIFFGGAVTNMTRLSRALKVPYSLGRDAGRVRVAAHVKGGPARDAGERDIAGRSRSPSTIHRPQTRRKVPARHDDRAGRRRGQRGSDPNARDGRGARGREALASAAPSITRGADAVGHDAAASLSWRRVLGNLRSNFFRTSSVSSGYARFSSSHASRGRRLRCFQTRIAPSSLPVTRAISATPLASIN